MTGGDAWCVLPPNARDGTGPDELEPVRRFRGRLLFDDGLRPVYGGPGGPYDADPLDPVSHHVIAYRPDDPVRDPIAVLRVLPLTGGPSDSPDGSDDGDARPIGVCDRVLGPGTTFGLLDRLGVDPAGVWEGSGWAVRPGPGRARLSARTLAAAVAVARDLGRTTLVGVSGTRYGQLHRVLAAGFSCVDGVRPVPVPTLADDLQLVVGRLDELRPSFRALVDEMVPRLAPRSRTRG